MLDIGNPYVSPSCNICIVGSNSVGSIQVSSPCTSGCFVNLTCSPISYSPYLVNGFGFNSGCENLV